MRFEIKAVKNSGEVTLLALEALNDGEAVNQVKSQGYTVLAIKQKSSSLALPTLKHSRFQLLLFTQELLSLLEAGLALVEAIEALNEKEPRPESRRVLERLIQRLYEGQTLSVALQQFPDIFPPLYLATVRASEKTGDLEDALGRYVAYQTQADLVRKKMINASIYPGLLVTVGCLVLVFLLSYVVPRFAHVYEAMGTELPLFSRLLLAWGQLIEAHAITLLLALLAVLGGSVYLFSLAGVKRWIGTTLWKIPAVGQRMRIYQLARFYRMLGMLLTGGTPVVQALGMVSGLLQASLREQLLQAARDIREGRSISLAMSSNGLTTSVALRMLRVGERTGQMGGMMERIASFYEEEMAQAVERFTRLFEPALMAFIGLVIGGVVILMYLPIFELAGSIQ
ncbi:type II secretion system F family protein [Pseudogulbenkiania ferrooxidans]|uniref:Type II secretion system protein n=1 Tax=Pseudogulbenkiania ferrooxidans 2002 TaxID=279714 RepID=B9Z699_9NEIS|nr:type II secretion system F family protein [Pseudogulbenkiania ferrooxidans]EEG07743.1 type II secretion system protein [Pseudogulbenkiania ferrooxidans 2002]